eukprot:3572121-Alexandrium_andersonii.AAC.1
MSAPPLSVQFRFRLPCAQTPAPPHSAQWCFCRPCGHRFLMRGAMGGGGGRTSEDDAMPESC